jgi:hypothetical protein
VRTPGNGRDAHAAQPVHCPPAPGAVLGCSVLLQLKSAGSAVGCLAAGSRRLLPLHADLSQQARGELQHLAAAGSCVGVVRPAGRDEPLQRGTAAGRQRWPLPLHSNLQEQQGSARHWGPLHEHLKRTPALPAAAGQRGTLLSHSHLTKHPSQLAS